MSTPNPLAPQGSLLEQHPKGRSMFHVISFIGVVHVMLLCGILWTACGRDEKKVEPTNTLGNDPYGAPPSDPVPGVAPGSNTASNLTATLPVPTPGAPGSGGGTTPTPPPPGGGTPALTSPPVPTLPPAVTTTPGGSSPTPGDTAPISDGPVGDYKVVKGDIGSAIARKHGVSVKALIAANPTVNWSRLKVGQTLQIPAGGNTAGSPAPAPSSDTGASDITAPTGGGKRTYTVKAGDTGTRIAVRHGVKWAEIRRANNLKSDVLKAGQKLTIPGHSGGSAAAEAAGGSAPGSTTPIAIPVPRGPGQ